VTERILRETLLALLQGDEALYAHMRAAGLLPDDEAALGPEHVETARVVASLAHELEVNWAGVEVIVRMRSELCATRRQVAELLDLLRRRGAGG
jgi:hypothetical protein